MSNDGYSPRPLIPNRIVAAFTDCFAGRETLRTIDQFFEDMELDLHPVAEEHALEQGQGQRRSRVAGYLQSLRLADPADADVLLKAIELKLAEWERDANPRYRGDLDRLARNLDLSGFGWNAGRLVKRGDPFGAASFSTKLEALVSEDVDREIERILAAVDLDPADAITAARALVETVCKLVLGELAHPVDESDDLPTLYKKTAMALKLDPTQHDAVYRQTLQGLVSAVHGLAEVRNRLGDAHGKGRAAARAKPRHARMAAGAAMTVATFLVETMMERRALDV